jgi:RNA polymerase sigma-70 factor (ECF subfamily)
LIEKFKTADDEAIAAALAREPSEELCGELFRRYEKKVYLWSFNYTHDVEEAVELSQEIFVKIFRNIGGFAGRSRFSTWVYGVTRNHCLGELSKKRVTWRKRLEALEDSTRSDAVAADPFAKIETAEDLERILETARSCMEHDELEAFILHYREGLTVKEITRLLGCENASGARTLIQNARRKFNRLVSEKGLDHA